MPRRVDVQDPAKNPCVGVKKEPLGVQAGAEQPGQQASEQPGQQASDEPEIGKVKDEMLRYGQLISRDAEYLSLPDLALLSHHVGKKAVVAFFDEPGPPRLQCLTALLQRMCGQPECAMPDFGCSDTWFYVACRLDWKRAGLMTLNHFIPAWHRDQLDHDWEVARLTLVSRHRNREATLSASIVKALDVLQNAEEDEQEEAEANLFSLMDEKTQLRNEVEAVNQMFQVGLIPKIVPGDGNCGLWSTIALRQGFQATLNTVQGHGEVMELREALKTLWESVSAEKDEDWMRVFHHFMLSGVRGPAAPQAELKDDLPSGEKTPPRQPGKIRFAPDVSPEKDLDHHRKRARRAAFGQAKEKNHLMARAKSKVILREGEEQEEPEEELPKVKSKRGDKKAEKNTPAVDEEELREADANMVLLDDDVGNVRKLLHPQRIQRQMHSRSVKSKVQNVEDIQEKTVKTYLNSLGATWPSFQKVHHRPSRQGLIGNRIVVI